MPPKEDPKIGLTPKEIQMLSAVVSLMGDIPEISFDEVAKICGQKYARNARTSCKKLFEKLKANVGANDASKNGAESDKETGTVKKKATPKVKKTPGPRAAPKKASGTTKKASARKAIKEEQDVESENEKENLDVNVKEEYETDHGEGYGEDQGGEDQSEDQAENHHDEIEHTGKSEVSAPFNSHSPTGLTSTISGATATFSAGYQFPADATEEELHKAHFYEITVEEWRSWKIQNNYDAIASGATSHSDE